MDFQVLTRDEFALLFSSATAAVIVGLMLFMSYRLHGRNRRQAYRSLLVSLVLILIHQLMQLAHVLEWTAAQDRYVAVPEKLLQVYAFIVINFAVFELYHRRRPRTRLWLYGLMAAGIATAVADYASNASSGGALTRSGLFHSPALDGFLLLLAPLFLLMFAPHVGQPRKYVAGLIVFFASQLSTVAATYWSDDPRTLTMVAGLLPIAYYVLLFMLLFERVVELLQSVYRSSITDGLTNLYNRRFFSARLDQALRTGKPVGVVFCDIDNFKRLNDTHGHHKADGVLKQVAAILMEETEGAGLAGRYGGEELVAFVAAPALIGLQVAEAIRARTEKESLVTVSVGFSLASPGVSHEELLKQADQAMYHSKTTGKNRVTDYAKLQGAESKHA